VAPAEEESQALRGKGLRRGPRRGASSHWPQARAYSQPAWSLFTVIGHSVEPMISSTGAWLKGLAEGVSGQPLAAA
jgi:hypothetical protein